MKVYLEYEFLNYALCTEFHYIWQPEGVRCLVSTISIRLGINSFKQEDVNGRSHYKWSSNLPNHIFLDVMQLESNLLCKIKVLGLESNLLFPRGGYLLHTIGR